MFEIQGLRDLRMIERCMKRPEWQFPDGMDRVLPAMLMKTIVDKHPETHHDPAKRGKYVHSTSARMKAIRLLMQMWQQNLSGHAKPAQQVDVHVSGELHLAVEDLRKADLSPEELQQLAATADLFDQIEKRAGRPGLYEAAQSAAASGN